MRFRIVQFADFSGVIGSGSVEIAQRRVFQSVGGIAVGQHVLYGQFGVAVWIGGSARMFFGNGNCHRFPVNGCSG
jgi:hypothetical protein